MLVSVIITSYNHENHISNAINSVASQRKDLFDIELIIGDDCSTDRTYIKIKESLKANNFSKVILKKNTYNLGVSQNIFNCMSLVTGDFICFLDGDDYWIDNCKLENQVRAMQENNVDFIFDRVKYVNKKDEVLNIKHISTPKDFDEIFMGVGDIHTSTTMYSKRAIEKIKLISKKFLQNDAALLDLLFWLSSAESFNFYHNEKISVAYRKDISSMSNSQETKKLLFMNKNILVTLVFFFRRNKKISYLPIIIRRAYLFIKFSFKEKNFKDYLKIFIN